ncbi:hypothetical protein JCM8547_004289 [Rhodosporidiobolus lusitaniae]
MPGPLTTSDPTSPSTSVASSSASWPTSDLAASAVTAPPPPSDDDEDSTAAPPSPTRSLTPSPPAAPALTVEIEHIEVATPPSPGGEGGPSEEDVLTAETPVSATWSRSRVPVSDLEDEGLSPVVGQGEEEGEGKKVLEPLPLPSGGEEKEEKEEKQAEQVEEKNDGETKGDEENKEEKVEEKHDDSTTPTGDSPPSRPAFLLTRPTLAGENETVAISQPSTPSASVHGDDDEKKVAQVDEKNEEPKPAAALSAPSIQIVTSGAVLTDTKHFYASPVTATEFVPNSAISPGTPNSSKTNAFFGSFGFAGPVVSPPRPGGATITELPSDAELTPTTTVVQSITVVGTRTVKDADEDEEDQEGQEEEKEKPSSGSTRPLISPPGALHPQHCRRNKSSRSRSRSQGRRQYRAPVEVQTSSDSDSDDDDAPRPPRRGTLIHSRTIVSTAAAHPPQRQRPTLFRQRQGFQQAPARPVRAGRVFLSDRYDGFFPAKKLRRPDRRHDRDNVWEDVPPPRASSPPPPPRRQHNPLESLLRDIRLTLEEEPAAYYAVKGVLAEYEERNEERFGRKRAGEEHHPGYGARGEDKHHHHRHDHHGEEHKKPHFRHRFQTFPEPHQAPQEHHRAEHRHGRRKDRRPAPPRPRYSLTQTSDESETEVEGTVFKLSKPSPFFSSSSTAVPSARTIRNPPDAPSYPPHLSPRKRTPAPPFPPPASSSHPLVRPIPIRAFPPHPSSLSSPPFPSPRAQTLTVAQATALAAKLGNEDELEKLRKSGLRAGEKVSKLEEKRERGWKPAELVIARGLKKDGKEKEGKEGKEKKEVVHIRRRRHSFDAFPSSFPSSKFVPQPYPSNRHALVYGPSSAVVEKGGKTSSVQLAGAAPPSSDLKLSSSTQRPLMPPLHRALPSTASAMTDYTGVATTPKPEKEGKAVEQALRFSLFEVKYFDDDASAEKGKGKGKGEKGGKKGKMDRRESHDNPTLFFHHHGGVGGKEDGHRRKRAREGTYPPVRQGKGVRLVGGGGAKRAGSTSYDFDDFP